MKALEILSKLKRKGADFNAQIGIRQYEIQEAITELEGLLSLDDLRLQEIACLNSELEALKDNYEAQEIIIAKLRKELDRMSKDTSEFQGEEHD